MSHLAPHDWIAPDWPAPPHVHALCTTRNGGVSAAPYGSLNLGLATADEAAAVAANWAQVQAALDAHGRAVRPVLLHQVHGTDVLEVDEATPQRQRADASTTREPGVACVAMAADCLPVLLTDSAGTRVAAAHAGWRGLAGGVLEAVLEHFRASVGANHTHYAINNVAPWPLDVIAWIGPGIGADSFEVGPEVRRAFVGADAGAAAHFRPSPVARGKWLADLAGLARRRLHAAGVRSIHGNDGSPQWCTFGEVSRFFSHRRDNAALGGTGRMAALVWRNP